VSGRGLELGISGKEGWQKPFKGGPLTSQQATQKNQKLHLLFLYNNNACDIKARREMTSTSMATDNPFVDPITSFEEGGRDHSFAIDTLAVGKDASLTLGTDSLIVLGQSQMFSMNNSMANPCTR